MFSLYIKLGSKESVIKFGGYDRKGVKEGSEFSLITADSKSDNPRFKITKMKF